MKIWFDGVDKTSTSGPNSFAIQLIGALASRGHTVTLGYEYDVHVRLSFIFSTPGFNSIPTVLRLDGVWFNTRQDWNSLNVPIKKSYDDADHVIVQSVFDLELIMRYFGTHHFGTVSVVHNGVDIDEIHRVNSIDSSFFGHFKKVWMCASHWRPHKRLNENIECFEKLASADTCLIVAGKDANTDFFSERVKYVGEVTRHDMIALLKRSDVFVHLAYLDHSPNVVALARACGCKIMCTSSGGTHEIAGDDVIIFNDHIWDFLPCDLYSPPALDFTNIKISKESERLVSPALDINDVAVLYENTLTTAMLTSQRNSRG